MSPQSPDRRVSSIWFSSQSQVLCLLLYVFTLSKALLDIRGHPQLSRYGAPQKTEFEAELGASAIQVGG